MAIYETTKCDLCGYIIQNPAADTCPNCGADLDKQAVLGDHQVYQATLNKRLVDSFTFRLSAVDNGSSAERLAVLPESWAKLKQLAQALDEDGRKDVQNTLDMLTAGILTMAGRGDSRCLVVNHFLRSIGKHLAVTLGDLHELERYIRETAPHFPSWRPDEILAESIGMTVDGLQAIRDGVPVSCGDSLDDLPKWDVNVQPMEPRHALHRLVCIQAPDPLTARMVELNVARERWPGF